MSTTAIGAPTSGRRSARVRRRRLFAATRTNIGLVVVIVWGLAPVYWMVVNAFRDPAHIFDTTPWPTHLTLGNFTGVFSTATGNHFARALVNSVIIGAATTVVALAAGVFTAYALARLEFRGKNLVLGVILAASMFPGVALLTPLFGLFTNIGWYGTYPALIIPNISFVLPLTIYTLTTFFRELPWELEEAARLDGASRARAFGTVLLPLAAPGMVTTAILAFIAAWNEYLIASQLADTATQPVTRSPSPRSPDRSRTRNRSVRSWRPARSSPCR